MRSNSALVRSTRSLSRRISSSRVFSRASAEARTVTRSACVESIASATRRRMSASAKRGWLEPPLRYASSMAICSRAVTPRLAGSTLSKARQKSLSAPSGFPAWVTLKSTSVRSASSNRPFSAARRAAASVPGHGEMRSGVGVRAGATGTTADGTGVDRQAENRSMPPTTAAASLSRVRGGTMRAVFGFMRPALLAGEMAPVV